MARKFLVFICISFAVSFSPAVVSAYNPFNHFVWGFRDFFDWENVLILAVGGAAAGISVRFDSSVREFFDNEDRLGHAERIGFFWGSGAPNIALGIGAIVYGNVTNQEREVGAGQAQLEAFAVSTGLTYALKSTVRRRRPDGSDNYSFPSYHSSSPFSFAGSLTTIYGWRVGIPAVVLGGFSGVSRLASNKHYLSDVIFGATIGYVVGRAFSIHHILEEKTLSWSVMPYLYTRQSYGVDFVFRF